MPSLPYAYSIELDDVIDAEQAYEAFWSNEISNPSAFTCPENNCEGNATCINIEKAENDMVQHPHFRGYNHSLQCVYHQKNIRPTSKSTLNGSGSKSEYDELSLSRPEKLESTTSSNVVEGKTRAPKNTGGKSGKIYQAKYFSIRSLVSKFVEHRKHDEEQKHFVKIDNIKLSYKDLFIGVYNQDINNLPQYNRIFWGVAFLDKVEANDYYTIRFAENLEVDGQKVRPTCFLSEDLINTYHSRLIGTRIKNYSKEKSPRVIVFIYGKAYSPKKEGKKYINIKLENLDMLDIRGMDFFEKLRKE